MDLKLKTPIYETIPIGILLAAVGGFLDAYTYMLRGGVFANAQTGNIVLLGIEAAQGNWKQILFYLLPILAFSLGVLLTELIKKFTISLGLISYHHIIIFVEILLLFVIGWIPLHFSNAVVNIVISFICSIQVCSFRILEGSPYATTMCTGNLRSAMDCFCQWLFEKNMLAKKKCVRYLIIIVVFCMGAAFGSIFSFFLKERAIWIACGILLIIFIWMLFNQQQKTTVKS